MPVDVMLTLPRLGRVGAAFASSVIPMATLVRSKPAMQALHAMHVSTALGRRSHHKVWAPCWPAMLVRLHLCFSPHGPDCPTAFACCPLPARLSLQFGFRRC